MRYLIGAIGLIFSFSVSAAPKSVRCVFDYDDSLILKLSGDFKSGRSVDLTQLQLFDKVEGAEDTNLITNYNGPTKIEAAKAMEVSWKFTIPGEDGDYGNTYILSVPKDYERRLSVNATVETGGWNGENEFALSTLNGSCTINQF